MKLNHRTGRVVHGTGSGSRVCVDGVLVPRLKDIEAGNWGWLGEHEIAGPGTYAHRWVTLAYDLKTDALRMLEGGAYENNTNVFGASPNGTWAASGTRPFEVRSNLWVAPMPGVLHTVTRDGWVITGIDNSGYGLIAEHREHGSRVISGARFVAAEDGWLLFRLDDRLVLRLLERGSTEFVPDIGNPAAIADVNGNVCGVIWLRGTTVTYWVTSAEHGRVVGTGTYYNPALSGSGTTLRIVSSRRQGEQPDDWQDQTIDLSGPTVLLADLREPLPPLTDVPQVRRPFTVVAFAFNDTPIDGLAHFAIPVRPSPQASYPQVMRYVGQDGTDTSFALTIAALRKGGPGMLYADSFDRETPPPLLAGEVYSEPFYRNAGESIAAYTARCRGRYDSLKRRGVRCWPCIGAHRRGGSLSVAECVEAVVAMTQLANEQGWEGMAVFALGRGPLADGGMDSPDELLPYLARFFAGLTGSVPLVRPVTTPVTPPARPPSKPPVTPLPPPVDLAAITFEEEYPMRVAVASRVRNFRDGKISNGFEDRPAGRIFFDEEAHIRRSPSGRYYLAAPNQTEVLSIDQFGNETWRPFPGDATPETYEPGSDEAFIREGGRFVFIEAKTVVGREKRTFALVPLEVQ